MRLLGRLERLAMVEASSALVLLGSAAVALVWANSPWASSYHSLWQTPVMVDPRRWLPEESLQFWIDEGLMTIFFLSAGLEIRREVNQGELSDRRRAALPIIAALGGMLAPALLYLAVNREPAARRGWGIPTATDIAFALGILGLLGKRVPPALRSFLLALAIIDDIGAIALIAIFYGGTPHAFGLGVAGSGLLLVWVLQRAGVRSAIAYAVPGGVVWWGLHRAGVHPAMTGVVLGVVTPAGGGAAPEQMPAAVSLEARLRPWVAYGVMPIFALANAGVTLGGWSRGAGSEGAIVAGVVLGLVAGKPLGIVAASFAAVKLRFAALPRGVGWRALLAAGCMGGIGFTVAMFMVGVAFRDRAIQAAAKLAVLSASALAAGLGLVAGFALLPPSPGFDGAGRLEVTSAVEDQFDRNLP